MKPKLWDQDGIQMASKNTRDLFFKTTRLVCFVLRRTQRQNASLIRGMLSAASQTSIVFRHRDHLLYTD